MRDIRESKLFAEQRSLIGITARRLDAALEGAVLVAANRAELVPAYPGTSLRRIGTKAGLDAPELIVLFVIESDDVVEFRWLEVAGEVAVVAPEATLASPSAWG